jgi:hypothetical protein
MRIAPPLVKRSHWKVKREAHRPTGERATHNTMDHWQRELIPEGFKWIACDTATIITLQIQENRWTASVAVLLASGERERARFFVEDCFDASLQKCLLYAWRALASGDKSTFDLKEALADLRRFAP